MLTVICDDCREFDFFCRNVIDNDFFDVCLPVCFVCYFVCLSLLTKLLNFFYDFLSIRLLLLDLMLIKSGINCIRFDQLKAFLNADIKQSLITVVH